MFVTFRICTCICFVSIHRGNIAVDCSNIPSVNLTLFPPPLNRRRRSSKTIIEPNVDIMTEENGKEARFKRTLENAEENGFKHIGEDQLLAIRRHLQKLSTWILINLCMLQHVCVSSKAYAISQRFFNLFLSSSFHHCHLLFF